MVRILVTCSSLNRRYHSLPISLNSSMSIWWFKNPSTFRTSSFKARPSFKMRSSNSFMLLYLLPNASVFLLEPFYFTAWAKR